MFWGIHQQYLNTENIVNDWVMLCASWKKLGDKKVSSVRIKKRNDDYPVVKELRDALSKADILIAHNGDKFDLKMLNARLLYHNLEPLPPIPTVDTLKQLRKIARFTSNKLDYVSSLLLNKRKLATDYGLWRKAMALDEQSLNKMVSYNKRDVVLLEGVYNKIKKFMPTHPHVGVMGGNNKLLTCRVCGSDHLKKDGVRVTASGIAKQQVKCVKCGTYTTLPPEK